MSQMPDLSSEPVTSESEVHGFDNPRYYLNRELSHLYFNQRVLAQALDEGHPLLERLNFLLIFSSNLDEFFEIRVAGLIQSIKFQREMFGLDGMQAKENLKLISEICHGIVDHQYQILNDILVPELQKQGIRFVRRNHWTPEHSTWIEEYFQKEILPVLSPIGLDSAHPFPRLVNKSLNFMVALEGKDAFGRDLGLAIVPAPRSLPRFIALPPHLNDGNDFVFLSSMIHAHTGKLFPGMTVKGCYQFRITRNADLDVDIEGAADLARALRGELHSRRFGTAVRIEVADNCPKEITDYLLRETGLSEDDLYRVNGPVNLKRLMRLPMMVNRPDLLYPPLIPTIPKGFHRKDNIFEAITKKDYLLLHPFESFAPVVQFLRQAAKDPQVVAIKQTLYRTGNNSAIVDALVDAARNGTEVTVVVELRARFDEEENLELASRLQEAGAVVVYGVVGYKTHAKMILVVRRENNHYKRYCHLGTGNYHAANAHMYTDYSLLTADDMIGEDVHRIFHQLTGMGRTERMHKLFHAPFTLKRQLVKFIEHEIKVAQEGKPARIVFKCNGLTEPKIIHSLYKASQAGVKIDLIVRGMCCLKSGIESVSENIQVHSIVGRFLEHARVYYFANSGVYCASADLMERNLNRRVEVCFPIEDPTLSARVLAELELYLNDGKQRWTQTESGQYHRVEQEGPAAQNELMRLLAGPAP